MPVKVDTFPSSVKPTMPTPTLTRDILLAALAGFQLDKQRIDTQIAETRAMLGSSSSPETGRSVSRETPKKVRLSEFLEDGFSTAKVPILSVAFLVQPRAHSRHDMLQPAR
jgi:hypothetical protein